MVCLAGMGTAVGVFCVLCCFGRFWTFCLAKIAGKGPEDDPEGQFLPNQRQERLPWTELKSAGA